MKLDIILWRLFRHTHTLVEEQIDASDIWTQEVKLCSKSSCMAGEAVPHHWPVLDGRLHGDDDSGHPWPSTALWLAPVRVATSFPHHCCLYWSVQLTSLLFSSRTLSTRVYGGGMCYYINYSLAKTRHGIIIFIITDLMAVIINTLTLCMIYSGITMNF